MPALRLLLTNDDGIFSPILQRVAHALRRDHEVVVAAPSTDQSGKAHSFTHGPGRLLHYRQDGTGPELNFQVDGTPSDCVKFAITHLFRGKPFDLVVSGINLGENAGVSSIYSGTVAAAREAALWKTPAIAVSLWHTADDHVEHALEWLSRFVNTPELLPQPGDFYNINFPPCPVREIAGARICKMSEVMFTDGYVPVPDAHGITGFRLEGHKPVEKMQPGTDDHALRQHCIAIVPMRITQTHPDAEARLLDRRHSLNALTSASMTPSREGRH